MAVLMQELALIDPVPNLSWPPPDRFRSQLARTAFWYFGRYVVSTVVQWNRIVTSFNEMARARAAALATSEPERTPLLESTRGASFLLDLDIHFFAITWDKVEKNLRRFLDAQSDPVVSQIVKPLPGLFTRGVRVRNYYEHRDKALVPLEAGAGSFGFGVAGTGADAVFSISFEEKRKGGVREPVGVSLGRPEVMKLLEARESIVDHLSTSSQRFALDAKP